MAAGEHKTHIHRLRSIMFRNVWFVAWLAISNTQTASSSRPSVFLWQTEAALLCVSLSESRFLVVNLVIPQNKDTTTCQIPTQQLSQGHIYHVSVLKLFAAIVLHITVGEYNLKSTYEKCTSIIRNVKMRIVLHGISLCWLVIHLSCLSRVLPVKNSD